MVAPEAGQGERVGLAALAQPAWPQAVAEQVLAVQPAAPQVGAVELAVAAQPALRLAGAGLGPVLRVWARA